MKPISTPPAGTEEHRFLGRDQVAELLARLVGDGRRVVAPVVRDGVVAIDEVHDVADLPVGWYDDQDAGRYRVHQRPADHHWFGYTTPSQPWRRYLQPPRTLVVRARRDRAHDGGEWHTDAAVPVPAPLALFGIRACDLHAIARLDAVLGADSEYARHRAGAVFVAVACTHAARSCFCASMGTGPEPDVLADIVLTELDDGLLARAATPIGSELLSSLAGSRPARREEVEAAEIAVGRAAAGQVRSLPADHRARLPAATDEAAWSVLAERCVSCGNCTMVCPTCFCTSIEDSTDLSGDIAERWRRWDGCFSLDFSHLHGGGPVRRSATSRYRQWLLHKLDTWHDQYGTSGCVGCGRCITWCPTGIDLTQAVARSEHEVTT
jgi:ferredoxin